MTTDQKKPPLQKAGSNRPRLYEAVPSFDTRHKASGKLYTRFVRFMRLFLPLIAISIIGLLVAWPSAEKVFAPVPKEDVLPKTIGKNELLNPRFESEDDRHQPFTITATRAVQSDRDPEMIFLEKPVADITLKNGTWLAAEADRGIYRQHDEKLLLEGKVKLFHDQGYEMKTEKLMIDLKLRRASSNVPVFGHGPAGTLQANGVVAEMDKGLLIFKGPVKLVLNRAIEGL